jgi:hypothetical protein
VARPFAIDSTSALISGVLLGVFIYWGWDSGVSRQRGDENPNEGRARRRHGTSILVLIYVIVASPPRPTPGPSS